jgi:hypothetical protein
MCPQLSLADFRELCDRTCFHIFYLSQHFNLEKNGNFFVDLLIIWDRILIDRVELKTRAGGGFSGVMACVNNALIVEYYRYNEIAWD